jgi:type II secretory pathway pseudopilin PulG
VTRAFTYLEMSVVVFILAILATGILLKLSASERGDIERGFRMSLLRLAVQAREAAQSRMQTVVLSIADSPDRVVAQLEGTEQAQELFAAALPQGVTFAESQLEGSTVSEGEWRASFFSDGTCEQAALRFDSDGETFSWVLDPKRATSSIVFGEIPEAPIEQWPAGEMEIRGGG